MRLNNYAGRTYAEPYAGGAGAALSLLFGEHVDRILINDADRSVFFFWKAALERTDDFCELVLKTPLTVEEWRRQRAVYLNPHRHSFLKAGFATFYLNRCNRSGIIANGGLIGGLKQDGPYKIDARFNREQLVERLQRIAMYGERITISHQDAVAFLSSLNGTGADAPFVYLDPPYFNKGKELYLNHYAPTDHATLARYLKTDARFTWVMTYDNTPEIAKLYRGLRCVPFDLDYTARERRVGSELMISRRDFVFPKRWKTTIPAEHITNRLGTMIFDAA
jgi:DNA adenine methylase